VQWLAILASSGVTPVDYAADSITGYILGFGPIGIIALAFAFRWIVPGRSVEKAVEQARTEARADLIAERDRLLEEKREAEEQRDEQLKIAQTQLVPLLVNFTATTTALIPLLQQAVRAQEGHDGTR
jgi:hypothetical protein